MAILFQTFDTTTNKPKYRSVTYEQETPSGAVNGSNVDFVLAFTPVSAGSVGVFIDGILRKATEYSVNLGTKTITFTTAPATAQDVYVTYVR